MRARSTASGLSDIDNSPRAMRLGKISPLRDVRQLRTLDANRHLTGKGDNNQ
jgi:hypothetical protein